VTPDRVLWGDSRIEAEFRSIVEELHGLRPLPERVAVLTDEIRAMRNLPERLAEFAVELRNLRKDVGHCFEAIRAAEDKREKRDDEQRRERKADRRWIVGSAMTAASLVIAALALLADRL
jgi:hypothetical protein